MHVLIGFVVKDRTAKFNDMQFEWIPQATKTARGWIETPKAMKQKINGEEIPEDILLRFIWSELLMADSPYLKIPIEEVTLHLYFMLSLTSPLFIRSIPFSNVVIS